MKGKRWRDGDKEKHKNFPQQILTNFLNDTPLNYLLTLFYFGFGLFFILKKKKEKKMAEGKKLSFTLNLVSFYGNLNAKTCLIPTSFSISSFSLVFFFFLLFYLYIFFFYNILCVSKDIFFSYHVYYFLLHYYLFLLRICGSEWAKNQFKMQKKIGFLLLITEINNFFVIFCSSSTKAIIAA